MFSRYFILHPVVSAVIALVLLLLGIVAIFSSPVEQYPNIVPPCITINASFPGASSEAIANAVAAPIEDQMSGVAHMIYMQSSSANGNSTYTLNLYFDVGTDAATVEADVLNRINTAMAQLPTQVQQQGVTVRLANPDILVAVPFYSKTGSPNLLYISNYVQRYILPEIAQIPDVGLANLVGQRTFAMRAILDTNKMQYYHVSTQEIINAIGDQNAQYAIGMTAMEPMQGKEKFNFVINSPGYYTDISQLKNTVIRADPSGMQVVKLSDLAQVKIDSQNYSSYFYSVLKNPISGKIHFYPATALQVSLVPGANQIEAKKKISAVLQSAVKYMPSGMEYYFHYDSSEYVKLSIQSVIITLLTAFGLVFMIVLLFIQNIRSAIIPILAIPVSIIGAFAFIYLFGFSINTLTLFGMVLAVGIVVDDAIVVVECVERIMLEKQCGSTEAALTAMKEVSGPIIAIVLVLNAVFVPTAFLSGFSGVLMRQFAVTIAISVTLSGLIALTLTPSLCAIFLKNTNMTIVQSNQFWILQKFNQGFEKIKQYYLTITAWNIDHTKTIIFFWISLCAAVILLFIKVPTGLIPMEDMGYFYNEIRTAPAGATQETIVQAKKIALEMMKLPSIERIAIQVGRDLADNNTTKTNTATLITNLLPYNQRKQTVDMAITETNNINNKNKNITGFSFNQPPIHGMSSTGGATFYLQAHQPISVQTIYEDSIKLIDYLQKNYPAVASAQQFYNVETPQLSINVDAKKAYLYGVTYADVFTALQSAFGNYSVNYFNQWNDLYWIVLQGEYRFRSVSEKINTLYVKSKQNHMIQLGSLVTVTYKTGPEVVTRFNDYLASQIVVNPNAQQGYTQGDVMKAINDAVPKVIGNRYSVQWFGPAYQENLVGHQAIIALIFGLIMIFLILAALYECWLLPAVVILALPCALFGAIFTLFVFQKTNDIYFQVSLLALMGLSAKNVILILEFALRKIQTETISLKEAALYAAKVRFRPIIMTSLAFIFGSVSLVIASGAGANAQHSVGTGIIGGMVGSTCLATLLVPLFFVLAMKKSRIK